jgi:GNAT superfamily N-acetyltransferase
MERSSSLNPSLYAKWVYVRVREQGPLSAIGRVFEIAWQRLFHGESIIFCFELNHIDFEAVLLPAHISVERKKRMVDISPDDMARLASVTNEQVVRRTLQERFEKGSDLWFAKIDDTIVTYRWNVRKTPLNRSERFFPFLDNDVYLYDIWTYKGFRGRNIPYYLDHYVLGQLKREGLERAFWAVYGWNKSSLRYTSKMPAYEFGRVRKVCIFNRDLVLWSRMRNQIAGPTVVLSITQEEAV